MQIKKIDVDSLASDTPNWSKITAVVGGQEMTLRLDDTQTARLSAVAERIVDEILSSLRQAA